MAADSESSFNDLRSPPIPAVNPGHQIVRIPPELHHSAAMRLVGAGAGERIAAGWRFLQAAPSHGIDLSLMWGTLEANAKQEHRVRQICLAVLGAGRTAVLFLSAPERPRGPAAERRLEHEELAASVGAACAWLAQERADRVRVVQSLPEPGEGWAIEALQAAGLRRVGELAYMRCPLSRRRSKALPNPQWPAGITVRPIASAEPGSADRARLAAALDRSYEATLDCPGLCGMRETEDVIDSHRSTGRFDPALWWLVFDGAEPHGCVLLNPCPDQNTVELVYLGLSTHLRGRGLARVLLAEAMARARGPGRLSVTCAVDQANGPALALYRRAGFTEFSGRIAMVRPLP